MERDHPLALELASLRGAVSKYQHSSHQSGIQLQGSRLEYTLLSGQTSAVPLGPSFETKRESSSIPPSLFVSTEKVKGLETENTRLQTEVEILR